MTRSHAIVPAILAILAILAAFTISACSASGPDADDRARPESGAQVRARSDELLAKHTEIWALMDLSTAARDELNGLVVAVNAQMEHNRVERPDAYAEAKGIQRTQGELTHDAYVANHKQRFDRLGISEPTQTELLNAAEFVWKALHDPSVPAEKKQVAEKIRSMMQALNGPPPCCDDNIFLRAR